LDGTFDSIACREVDDDFWAVSFSVIPDLNWGTTPVTAKDVATNSPVSARRSARNQFWCKSAPASIQSGQRGSPLQSRGGYAIARNSYGPRGTYPPSLPRRGAVRNAPGNSRGLRSLETSGLPER